MFAYSVQLLGKIPLKALQSFRRRLGNHLSLPEKRRNPMYMSQPITDNSNPTLARALQRLIPFHTVNSFPSRNWINASFSRPSKAPAKKLIQITDPKKSHDWRISWNSPVPEHAIQTEGDRVVQSVIKTVFNGGTSTYFLIHYLNIYFNDISNINDYFCLRKIASWQNCAIAKK